MDYYYDWRPYVSVATRRRQAVLELQKLAKKGKPISPVVIDGRKIAKTFWGKAWCDNLERYSDYANRLPRGRTYVRNGSVVDLQIAPGAVTAMVSGSSLYRIQVKVAEVPKARWGAVCRDCAGAIDSLVELLHGRFSDSVMTRICQEKTGLFPSPAEITFTCSCPDWASMCKHVAAVLYGIGARLDEKPDLLFALRKVDHQDLIAGAGKNLTRTRKGPKAARVLDSGDLSEMFGIDMAQAEEPRAKAARKKAARKPVVRIDPPAARPEPAPRARPAQRKTTTLTAKKRLAISERMKKYWLAKRKGKKPI
jgi:uncharacterized Zn finger protein